MTIDAKWQKDLEQYFISNVSYGGKFVSTNAQGFIPVQNKIPAYDGFDSIPYYNYCYNSAYAWWSHLGAVNFTIDEEGDDILHLAMSTDSDNESGAVKHYFASRTPTSGGIDPRIFLTDLEVHQRNNDVWQDNTAPGYLVAANYFNPWTDMYFNRIKLGIRFKVIDTTIPWGLSGYVIDVDNLDDLKNLDKDRYYVWRTETYNWIKNDAGGWYRGYDHQSSFDVCNINSHFIVQQNGYWGGSGSETIGLNLVPQCMFDFYRDGDISRLMGDNMPLRSADTGYNVIGLCPSDGSDTLDLKCVVGSLQRLKSGITYYCTTRYGTQHRYVFRQVMHIDDILREVAYLGIIICPFTDPDTNTKDYIGYVNADGEATGELIPYSDWDKSDSLQLQHNLMSEMPDIPVKPPYKPEKEDYDDDKSDSVKYGLDVNNYLGAFLNFYCCNVSDLGDLRTVLRGQSEAHPLPAGFDPAAQLVSLTAFPLAINLNGTTAGTDEIKFRTSSGETVSTGVRCPVSTGGVYLLDFGEITIPKRMEQRGVPFLDYGTTIEIYLPFSGIYNLDTQTCVGRKLSVKGYLCISTGQINYIVVADKDGANIPVCYASGMLGAEMPITSSGWGLYKANQNQIIERGITSSLKDTANAFSQGYNAVISSTVSNTLSGGKSQTLKTMIDALGTVLPKGTIKPSIPISGKIAAGIAAAGGLINVGSNIADGMIAGSINKNSSYTTVGGSLSGTSSWFMPLHAYVRLIRPRFRLAANYAHTYAIPQVRTKKIGSCKGLTICSNTDLTSINCTFNERELIGQYLSNGIYV